MNILRRMGGHGGRAVLTGLVFFGLAGTSAPAIDHGNVQSLAAWVDGVELPPITNWEGGDPRIRYTGAVPLTPVGVDYAPLIIDFNLAPAPALQAWLKDFCARRTTPHRLVISEVNPEAYADKAMVTREYVNVRITEARWFLAIREDVTPFVRITFQADSLRTLPRQNPTVAPVGGTKAQWAMGRLGEREPELVVPADGPARFTARMSASVTASSWAWRDLIVGNGTAPTAQARTSEFTFLSGGSSETLFGFRLNLSGVHLVRFTRDSTATKSNREADAEFLVESVAVTTEADAAAAAPRVALPATIPFVTSTYTPPPAPSVAPPAPASPETGASASPTGATPFVVPGRDPNLPVKLSPTATPPSVALPPRGTATAVATNDLGLRDPVQFPRPDGLERQRFDVRSSPARLDESALYTTPRAFDELMKQYEEMAARDGWREISRSESGSSPTDRMTMTYWTRAGAEADLRVYGRKTGVEVSLSVSVPRTAKKTE